MVIEVTVVKTPSVAAQQNGHSEEIVVPSTRVVAESELAAAVIVGSQNGKSLEEVNPSFIRVITARIG